MFEELEKPTYNPSWQVPGAQYIVSSEKKTKYCIVIPVLNEGEKIRDQLSRMHKLDIPAQADILIADGGSTDGSLDDKDFLASKGVRALLIKRDKGRLGAQLRIAYAYAMHEGYDGVITVDGNNKDSVESTRLFITALERGVDYVQGSRWMKGGRAVNTPLIRYLAIRLLHTPLVSLAARKRLDDTTNGFRAYSKKYLLHPGVQPFRDIFQRYELLAYLSARASRLGLRIEMVPVARVYPRLGPVPTKISSFHGNLSLLKVLIDLLLGRYNPPKTG